MKNDSVSKGGDIFQGSEVLPKMMPTTITLHEDIMRNIWDIEKEQINPFTYGRYRYILSIEKLC